MKYVPVGPRVLVEIMPKGEVVSKHGIILSTTEEQAFDVEEGVVVSMGEQAFVFSDVHSEPWVKIGETVRFKRYGGSFKFDPKSHKNFRLIEDKDILMVVRED